MTGLEPFRDPLNFPWLLGAYLGVNAIPDAWALVDGPDCTLYKAHFIHGRHDTRSTLLQIDGHHRVAFTNVCSRGVVQEHDRIVADLLATLDALPDSRLLLATALPMCSITGMDYARIIRDNRHRLHKPTLELRPGSMLGDWLDGYAALLDTLARGLDFHPGPKRRRTAAVIGYLMDRNEADHLANLAELRRMLAAVDLELVSVWLGGQPVADLQRAGRAEYLISLPYGRRAARSLARSTGARLVEAELPFGLPKTAAFLRQVGAAAHRAKQAESFLSAELARVIPRLQWILPHLFLHRRVAFIGDPYLLDGFCDLADDCGMTLTGAVVTARAGHGGGRPGLTTLHEPSADAPDARRLLDAAELLVGSRAWRDQINTAGPHPRYPSHVELGFPSYEYHALLERPFLGTNGVLGLVERMADALYRSTTPPPDR